MVVSTVDDPTPVGLGRPCLNFLATVSERRGQRRERLTAPSDLADWLVETAVLENPPRLSANQLAAARDLREAIHRIVTAEPRPDPADVETLNGAARPPTPIPALSADGTSRQTSDQQSFRAAMSVLARDAIDLVSSPARARVRTCAAQACGAPFLDTSRPGRRRWCYMGRCGNRAKKASYRKRQRAET